MNKKKANASTQNSAKKPPLAQDPADIYAAPKGKPKRSKNSSQPIKSNRRGH
jgi:hypothetical protein